MDGGAKQTERQRNLEEGRRRRGGIANEGKKVNKKIE
jgi:hypothetical protein